MLAFLKKDIKRPTDDGLQELYYDKNRTTYEIAELFGVDSATISNWMKKAGIERRNPSEARFVSLGKKVEKPSDELLHRWYLDEGMSTYEIGGVIRVSSSTVIKWLREAGIPVRHDYHEIHGYDFEKPSDEQLRRWYIDEKKSTVEIGEIVGVTHGTISSWLKQAMIPIRDTREQIFARFGKEIEKPSKEQLRKWYEDENMSTYEIAEIFGVSHSAISRWLKEEGIKIKDWREKMGYDFEMPSNDQLWMWYIDEKKSPGEIGELVGVSSSTILNWLTKAGIPKKEWREAMGYDFVRPPTEELYNWYVNEQMSAKKIAESLGVSQGTIQKLLKECGIERRSLSEARFAHLGKEIQKPSNKQLRDWYLNRKMSTREIGEIIGVDKSTVSGWLKDGGMEPRESLYGYNGWLQCEDGHEVGSGYERRVDNWLYFNGIAHNYNKKLGGGRDYRYDFRVEDWYIEVWGLAGVDFYDEKTKKKIAYYEEHNLKRIDIFPDDFGATNDYKKKLEPLLEFSNPEKRRQRSIDDFNY